jgi:2',3'-cyclic-nucleotide 2'-phosphodiesterase/3'-nucleotidase
LQGANFPYVNANVYLSGADQDLSTARHAFTPYVLLKRSLVDAKGQTHPITVGVIGFVPPQIMQWDRGNLEGQVVARGIVQTAEKYVPLMRAQGAQLVIAIPHAGFEKGPVAPLSENAVGALALVPGIDAILFGHAHAEFPSKDFADYPKADIVRGTINGVAAVMPGRWGDHLGVIDLTLDHTGGQWKVVDRKATIRPIYDRIARKPMADADPVAMQTVGDIHAQTLDYVRQRVTFSSAPIYSYFALVADDPSVQLVANAQIAYTRRATQGTDYEKFPVLSAASPFKTGGRQGWDYFTDIPAGPLSIKHVADLYVYPNTLKAMLLTGAEVREWIEMSAGQFLQIDPKGPPRQPLLSATFRSYNFDTLDGVTYALDVTQPAKYDTDGAVVAPAANRVKDLSYQGKPVRDDDRFVVATNNYRAFGGGNFPGLTAAKVIIEAPEETRQVLIEYLRMTDRLSANGQVNPSADNNWRILPVPGVHMTFVSASAGIQYLPRHPNIRLLQDNGDGSALYELAP